MPTSTATLLHCPIRGDLQASSLAADGLTLTEEAQRIDFLEFLLDQRNYPVSHIAVETVVMTNIGNAGRNSLRADVIVYDEPADQLAGKSMPERLEHALLVAEIKREANGRASAVANQLEPALRVLPRMDTLGVYWDDQSRDLFTKRFEGGSVWVDKDSVANLPVWGAAYQEKAITSSLLTVPKNLLFTLNGLADVMRSHGLEDKRIRYTETVKLLLARYVDEREAAASDSGTLALQVMPGNDPTFRQRVDDVYKKSALRYSRARSLFQPDAISSLDDDALRALIQRIQGFKLSAAANETMQQIFMSFVPAVFKKELSQYFTPLSLIETVVSMVGVGPNDKVVDPAMGTADFLSAALSMRSSDPDIAQRLFGIDRDPAAYELAVINMILNRDGQSGLECEDSIANPTRWQGEMNVALCNPPFGSRTVQKDRDVLKQYDLGHAWTLVDGRWTKSSTVLPSQQLGLLFVERCWQLLADGGRAGIILPEGYLCGDSYMYFRQWLLDRFNIVALVELPRRIFAKSDADLRSNILVVQKKAASDRTSNYKVYASMVRKVGYKLGGDFSATPQRDEQTGLPLRDEQNEIVLDSDFNRVLDEYSVFQATTDRSWTGAHISDITSHPTLDLKPRRLVKRALDLVRELNAPNASVALSDVADVITQSIFVGSDANSSKFFRAVEGSSVRAVEGTVSPGFPERGWQIAMRKQSSVYSLRQYDIVVGLVRPERRNVGILLDAGTDIVGIKDGVGIIRLKPDVAPEFTKEWLFAALRSEDVRVQLWTLAGGTSYGKLTLEHLRSVRLRTGDGYLASAAQNVGKWLQAHALAQSAWSQVGTEDDRRPILNSPLIGLIDGADAVGEAD